MCHAAWRDQLLGGKHRRGFDPPHHRGAVCEELLYVQTTLCTRSFYSTYWFSACEHEPPAHFCIFYFHSLHQSWQWKWREEHSEHSGGLAQTSTRCAPQTRYCVQTTQTHTHAHTLTEDFVQLVFRDSVTHAAIWKFHLVRRFKSVFLLWAFSKSLQKKSAEGSLSKDSTRKKKVNKKVYLFFFIVA